MKNASVSAASRVSNTRQLARGSGREELRFEMLEAREIELAQLVGDALFG